MVRFADLPPGQNNRQEILPAVLRRGRQPRLEKSEATSTSALTADELGSMLRGSTTWSSTQATVTWRVTTAAYLLTALGAVAAIVAAHSANASGFFAGAVTWHWHASLLIAVASSAILTMVMALSMTEGFRRGDRRALSIMSAGMALSVIAISGLLVAMAAMAIMVVLVFLFLAMILMALMDSL